MWLNRTLRSINRAAIHIQNSCAQLYLPFIIPCCLFFSKNIPFVLERHAVNIVKSLGNNCASADPYTYRIGPRIVWWKATLSYQLGLKKINNLVRAVIACFISACIWLLIALQRNYTLAALCQLPFWLHNEFSICRKYPTKNSVNFAFYLEVYFIYISDTLHRAYVFPMVFVCVSVTCSCDLYIQEELI